MWRKGKGNKSTTVIDLMHYPEIMSLGAAIQTCQS